MRILGKDSYWWKKEEKEWAMQGRDGNWYIYKKDKYKNIKLHSIKPDLDNMVKMIADIIQPQMIFDDSQIYWISAVKLYAIIPRTEVIIEEVS